MKKLISKSKNKCPNCGNRYWYSKTPVAIGRWNFIGTDALRFFPQGLPLAVDDPYIARAMDICTKCSIVLTVYGI